MIRPAFASLAALVAMAAPAAAQSLPQYVKGPLSGFAYECAEEKQAFNPRSFVTAIDLDGDGKPDHIFDIARGCPASKLLYCTDDGCLIDVFISSTELKEAGHKVMTFRIGRRAGMAALILSMRGEACGGSGRTCEKTLFWTGQGLALE